MVHVDDFFYAWEDRANALLGPEAVPCYLGSEGEPVRSQMVVWECFGQIEELRARSFLEFLAAARSYCVGYGGEERATAPDQLSWNSFQERDHNVRLIN